MLIEVRAFCDRVRRSLPHLLDQLQEETGRTGAEEREAWGRSLPRLCEELNDPLLAGFHLHLSEPGFLSVEYRLPASASWCDVVLLGMGPTKHCAVVIELKDWDTEGDRPGPRAALMFHQGSLTLHPSDQVRGYVDYCQNFHSVVQADGAEVHGCVLFTKKGPLSAYRAHPHGDLVKRFPVFGTEEEDKGLAEYLGALLKRPDSGFAARFVAGQYEQNRNFVTQVARVLQDPERSPYVLLDEQRKGYELCLQEIGKALTQGETGRKQVIIIEGPPGSGKSALAANLWASLVQDHRIYGSVVLTTTSGCQKSNWRHLYEQATPGARGITVAANRYNPGLTGEWASARSLTPINFRENIRRYIRENPSKNKAPDDAFDVSVVDEAHALIDPTDPCVGSTYSGWCWQAGPQAWHIIRSSRISVFLMDSEQSYRDNETTTRSGIEEWATEFKAEITRISLAGAQFRCGGSVEYLDWLQNLLNPSSTPATTAWQVTGPGGKPRFVAQVVDTLPELESRLRVELDAGRTARLAASYAREWVTRREANPHDLQATDKDFCFRLGGGGYWSRIWNFAPNEDYTLFIQRPVESRMHADPLCEIGCPYVLRGFDFDYLGVLWLGDLIWRKDRWRANLQNVHESAWRSTRSRARRGLGADDPALLARLKRGYRILLSRAIKGLYLWFEDEETREYVTRQLTTGGHPPC